MFFLFYGQDQIVLIFFSYLQILFPLFQEHHQNIEVNAEIAKITVMEKLGLCFKKEKGDKGEKISKSIFKKSETVEKKDDKKEKKSEEKEKDKKES